MAFEYKVPIIGQKRAGTEADPYIPITNDIKKVVDGYCKLNEIPDEHEHVTITAVASPYQAEVYTETFDMVNPIGRYNYRVDYVNGIVYFHADANGRTVTFSYKGRGVQFINAGRIFTKESNGNVTQTLDDALSLIDTIIETEGITIVEDSAINGNIKINGIESNVYTHPIGTNPHGTTKTDVGLGNVDNTSDANKPISIATQNALNNKINNSQIKNTLTETVAGNVLDATQGKVLDDKITLLSDQINEPDYSAETTEYANIFSLPSTVVQGSAKGKLKGRTVQNLVKNGNFANGTTGWAAFNATGFQVVNGIAEFTPTAASGQIYQTPLPLIEGNKYYIGAMVKSTRNVKLLLNGEVVSSINGDGTYKLLSGIKTDSGANAFVIADSSSSGFEKIYVDWAITIDLTTTYGAGKEPSKEQCDAMFSHYIDGMQSVQPQEIKSVGKNLFDKNKAIKGYYIKSNGDITPSSSGNYVSDYIEVEGNKNYRMNTSPVIGGYNAFYDINKNLISQNTSTNFTTPVNAKYVRFTIGADNIDIQQIEEGTVATPYEPYQESKAYMKYPLRSVPNGVCDEVDLQSGKLTKRCEEAVIDETWFSKATTNNPVGYDVYRVVNLFTTRMLPAGKIGAADGVTSLLSVDGVGFQRKPYWAQLDSLEQYATEADSNGIINLLVPTGQTFASVYGGKTIRFIYQLAQEQVIEDALSNQLTVYPSGTISLVAKKQYVLKAEDVVEMVSEGTYADFARIYITTLTDSMPFKTNVLGQVTLAGRTETPANGYNALENIGKFFVYDGTIDFVGVIFLKGTTLAEAQADLAGTIITYDTKPELSTIPTTVHSEPINLAGVVKSESDRNTRQDEQIRQLEMEKLALQQELDAHMADNVTDIGGVHGLIVESGTWTPSVRSSNNTSLTISDIVGRYVRMGNLVKCYFTFIITTTISEGAYIMVSGMPITPKNMGHAGVMAQYITGGGCALHAVTISEFKNVFAYALNTTQGKTNVMNGNIITGSFTYEI